MIRGMNRRVVLVDLVHAGYKCCLANTDIGQVVTHCLCVYMRAVSQVEQKPVQSQQVLMGLVDALSYFHSCERGVFDVFCGLVSWG